MVLLGCFVHLWYATHQILNSDQAVVGLMSLDILHGHFVAFYWGQSYGGVEPYFVAVVVALFGTTGFSLALAPTLLVAIAALLTWRTALRLVDDRMLAALAGTLVWIVPAFGITNSREFGFHNAALVCGAASLLLALRILDGRRRYHDIAGFGLALGVGWWASPESVYYILPALALVSGAVIGSRPGPGMRFWLPRLALGAAAVVTGALPWLWSNLPDGFRSLNSSSEASPTSGSYLNHLQTFFGHVLPIQLGLQRYGSGTQTVPGIGGVLLQLVVEAALVGAAVICLARRGRARIIGAAVLAFPLLYAVNPLASFWRDGRYGIYLPPLLALMLATGCEGLFRMDFPWAHRRARHRRAMSATRTASRAGVTVVATAVATVALVLAVTGFSELKAGASVSLRADPNAATEHAVAVLEQHHLMHGFANYWVGYKLDYLSGRHLVFTPVRGDQVRSESIYEEASSSQPVAWLFVPTAQLEKAELQFGTKDVEVGYDPEASFLSALRTLGDAYTVVHTGLIDAVVPRRPVSARQVGIGPP